MKTIITTLLFAAMSCFAQETRTNIINSTAQAGDSSATVLALEIQMEKNAPPPDFVAVQKQPVPILKPGPVYPDSARRTGIQGTVWVKVWIDEQGKPKKAMVLKSDNNIFNQASMDAVIRWTFEPAILNGKPVAVWVTIPFKYTLNVEKKSDKAGENIKPEKPSKKPATK